MSSHQHQGNILHQHKDYKWLKAHMMFYSIFSNKAFFKLQPLFDMLFTFNRIQYKADNFYMHCKARDIFVTSLLGYSHYIIVVWNWTCHVSKVFLSSYIPDDKQCETVFFQQCRDFLSGCRKRWHNGQILQQDAWLWLNHVGVPINICMCIYTI